MLFLQAGGMGAIVQFAPLAMILVVFYFFMIRPQMKRQKEQASFSDSLEKGKAFAEAGLLDDAKREFQQYLKQNPDSKIAKLWRKQIE